MPYRGKAIVATAWPALIHCRANESVSVRLPEPSSPSMTISRPTQCTLRRSPLADRIIGAEKTLFYAAVLVMCGHIALSLIPGITGVGVGLVLIAFGSGGVKANATSLVGTLYSADDPRRDAGFSIYYFGINLGAFLGPLLTGLLQTNAGFHWGFGLAAIGMAIGLTIYAVGRKNLPESSHHIPNPLPANRRLLVVGAAVVGVVLIAILSLTGVLTPTDWRPLSCSSRSLRRSSISR